MSRTGKKVGVVFAMFFLAMAPSLAVAQEQFVYLVNADNKAALTGFRAKGTPGIITALHGVVGAKTITASSAKGPILRKPLNLTKVDIKRDLALLSSPEVELLGDDGFEVAKEVKWMELGKVRIVGYPIHLDLEDISRSLEVSRPPLKRLEFLLDPTSRINIGERKSPELTLEVVNLQGPVLPGHSGAPVLDSQGRVLAVGNGGLGRGQNSIGWAIPLQESEWKPVDKVASALTHLKNASETLFALEDKPEEIEHLVDETRKELGLKIDNMRTVIENKMLDLQMKSSDAIIGIAKVAGKASIIAESNLEVKVLADDLEKLLTQFRSEVSKSSNKENDLWIRIVEASLANARQNFQRAKELLGKEDLALLRNKTATAKSEEAEANLTHGFTLMGMRNTDEAISCFERVRELKGPEKAIQYYIATGNLAICYFRKGENKKSIVLAKECINAYDKKMLFINKNAFAYKLAESRLILSGPLLAEGDTLGSLKEIHDSVVILENVTKDLDIKKNVHSISTLADCYFTQAVAYQLIGKSSESAGSFVKAIEIRKKLIAAGDHKSRTALAACLAAKGSSLDGSEHWADAIRYLSQSIELYSNLMEEGNFELEFDIAIALASRGNAYGNAKLFQEAMGDLNRSIEIFTDPKKTASRDSIEIKSNLVNCYTKRGIVYSKQKKLREAGRDFDLSVTLSRDLIAESAQFLPNHVALAESLINCGINNAFLNRFDVATLQLDESIDISRKLLISVKLPECFQNLALGLMSRGDCKSRKGDFDGAIIDLDESIQILKDLVANEKHGLYDQMLKNANYLRKLAAFFANLNKKVK